jgi:hypothetical protein
MKRKNQDHPTRNSTLNTRKRRTTERDEYQKIQDDDPRTECTTHLTEETTLPPRRVIHHHPTPQTSLSGSSSSNPDSDQSITMLGEDGKNLDMSHIKKDRHRLKMSQRIARQIKKLTVSDKLHDLKEFIATRGTIEQRKAYFQLWATTLQEMLAAHPRYQALMRDYPRLDASELSIAGNVALIS